MSPIGTFETCPPILRMSVHRGRPEVAVVRPNRREWPGGGLRRQLLTCCLKSRSTYSIALL